MKITYVLPLDLSGIPADAREDVKQEIADYLREAVLEDVGDGRSPLTGVKWKGLSAEYKKRKSEESSAVIANLELHGDMLDALEARPRAGNAVELGIWDGTEAEKADGHCNFSGDSHLPNRRFIPNAKDDETFRPGIMNEVLRIIDEAREEA